MSDEKTQPTPSPTTVTATKTTEKVEVGTPVQAGNQQATTDPNKAQAAQEQAASDANPASASTQPNPGKQ